MFLEGFHPNREPGTRDFWGFRQSLQGFLPEYDETASTASRFTRNCRFLGRAGGGTIRRRGAGERLRSSPHGIVLYTINNTMSCSCKIKYVFVNESCRVLLTHRILNTLDCFCAGNATPRKEVREHVCLFLEEEASREQNICVP